MTIIRATERNNGFTLIELLVAISIFAIIMSAIYSVYTSTLRIINNTELQIDTNNKARIALGRITKDLESVYLGKDGLFKGQKEEIGGTRGDLLKFTSTAHVVFSKKEQLVGFTLLTYSVEQDKESQMLLLYRRDVPFRPGIIEDESTEDKGILLCDGLKAVQFIFLGPDGTEVNNWQTETEQDGKKKLPAMIKIQLSFPDNDKNDLLFTSAVSIQNISKTADQ
jgi:general secretion pathway protein J